MSKNASVVDASLSGKPAMEQNQSLSQRHDSRIGDLLASFSANPGLCLILKPDLTILDASDEYLRSTLTWREEIIGQRIFDVFPDNPNDSTADGVKRLRRSFEQVLQRRTPHRMPVQKYDVRDQISGDNDWIEKFWAPVNYPVFGSVSHEIVFLIHKVQDVTEAIQLRRWVDEQSQMLAEQRSSLELMRKQLSERQWELRSARKSLSELMRGKHLEQQTLEEVRIQVAAPESRRYWVPGECAPVSGIYSAFHQRICEPFPIKTVIRAGREFSRCRNCQNRVLYRLRIRTEGLLGLAPT